MLDFSLPDPVGMIESIADEKLKRKAFKATFGMVYSAVITGLFEAGRKKMFGWGRVFQSVSRSIYLSLQPLEEEGILAMAIPKDVKKDLLDADSMSQFETEYSKKL